MTKLEKAEILKGLAALAVAFDREVSDERNRLYLEHLGDLTPLVVLDAMRSAIRSCKFFPSIAELRELAGAGTGGAALEDLAVRAWEGLRRLSGRKAYCVDALSNPITRQCWRALGGTLGFGQWDYQKQEEWKRKEFIGLYVAHAKRTPSPNALTFEESQATLEALQERGILRHV